MASCENRTPALVDYGCRIGYTFYTTAPLTLLCKLKGRVDFMVLDNVKLLLQSLRANDWYITAFRFSFNRHEYIVVFEDLRALNKGTKYYGACLTFLDMANDSHRLETYVNAYGFKESDEVLRTFFEANSNGNGNFIWNLKVALNKSMPNEYRPLKEAVLREATLMIIDKRDKGEGRCCYKLRRNGKKSNGEQKYRTPENTAKTKLLRESLFKIFGDVKELSFCYRKENSLSDAEIIANSKEALNPSQEQ
jgi:hypothetical protein